MSYYEEHTGFGISTDHGLPGVGPLSKSLSSSYTLSPAPRSGLAAFRRIPVTDNNGAEYYEELSKEPTPFPLSSPEPLGSRSYCVCRRPSLEANMYSCGNREYCPHGQYFHNGCMRNVLRMSDNLNFCHMCAIEFAQQEPEERRRRHERLLDSLNPFEETESEDGDSDNEDDDGDVYAIKDDDKQTLPDSLPSIKRESSSGTTKHESSPEIKRESSPETKREPSPEIKRKPSSSPYFKQEELPELESEESPASCPEPSDIVPSIESPTPEPAADSPCAPTPEVEEDDGYVADASMSPPINRTSSPSSYIKRPFSSYLERGEDDDKGYDNDAERKLTVQQCMERAVERLRWRVAARGGASEEGDDLVCERVGVLICQRRMLIEEGV